ncbi:MFS transporter [Amycolatopsis pithecellobii]|uniref:MFS transporter n=1 Tax=Amycolatopsis pithecellobii TaxID=664692 RepID=A0A6N7Z563_9PSEU|nr:MFS transporter [Amycolatopsis pithecellobii]MTD54526.1 MFS transporter [Amycolatopsis pithecellobii]
MDRSAQARTGEAGAMPTTSASRGLLAVLAATMLIDALEVSVMLVALPSVSARLGLTLTTAQWLVSGFALGFGGLLLFGARVVELLGRRRVYLAALAGFAAASVLSAVTRDPGVLIATRFVKGFCAALTAPTGMAIIQTTFRDGRDRNRAVSVYSLFGAAGFTTGLVLSGLLTEVSWQWTFLFPAPVALVLFAFGVRLIPGGPAGPPGGLRRFDLPGAASWCAALAALVYGIVSVADHGWADPRAFGALALAVLLMACFARVERVASRPLVRLGVVRDGTLIRSMLGAAALNGCNIGLLLTATVLLQNRLGWSPLQTALAFLPAGIPLVMTTPLAARIAARFGTSRLVALGSLGPPAACLLMLWRPVPADYTTGLLPPMLLLGAAFVLAFAALNIQAAARVSTADKGMAIGLYQSAVQVAAAVVPALTAALLATAGTRAALWLVTAVACVGMVAGLSGLRPHAASNLPESDAGA